MKAILIDPITATTQELDVVNDPKAGSGLAEYMCDENGTPLPDGFALAPIDKHNHMMVDETGMLPHRDPKHFFTYDGELYTGGAVSPATIAMRPLAATPHSLLRKSPPR